MNRLGSLGDVSEEVEQCVQTATEGDLDTKAGREQAFKQGAHCAADAYCAQYGVPPNVCGTVAEWVASGVIDVWNDIFGNEEEWEAYRARQAAHAAGRAAATQAMVADAMMTCALYKTAEQLADLWDEALPEKKGMWGPRVEQGPFEAYDLVKGWTDPDAPPIVVCNERYMVPTNLTRNVCPFFYAWLYVHGMQKVGMYCHTFPTGYRQYMKPLIYAEARALPLESRPAFVARAMNERVPLFMKTLGETAAKFGAMVAGLVAKREAQRAAANKEAWEKYEAAREEGERKSRTLNLGLLAGGAALLGGAWYFGRRRA